MSRFFALLILGSLLLCGCGGGGGGAVGPGFIVSAGWGGVADGQSELIQLYDQNNALQFFAKLNRPATSKTIFGVPNGTYHLHIELYALPDTTGQLKGVLDDVVTVSGTTHYFTTVGQPISEVKLSPASASVEVQHSQQFYATGQTLTGSSTFVVPAGFIWATTGGVASVDQNGIVIGTSQGTGSVTATDPTSNVSGSASLTVTGSTITHSKWTVIVFMNAANNLWQDSVLNMNQMERVADNPEVRFVVEWKQSTTFDPNSTFNSTRRYLVKPDSTNAIASEIVQDLGPGYDMGSAANMADFLSWAKTNYPADRYCVVVWNHGNGWRAGTTLVHPLGVSYDDDSHTHIDTWQLTQALGSWSPKIDILAWDASLMQQTEVDYEVKDQASYIVGSEESPPAAGYPYDAVFGHFRDNPDDSTLNLAKTFVDETVAAYGSSGKITQSVVDTSQLGNLATAASGLADALIANAGSMSAIVQTTRNTSQHYQGGVDLQYRDLYDVCAHLINLGSPAAVQAAAANVQQALGQAVVYEGHNANSPGSHGLSIDFSPSSIFLSNGHSTDYAKLKFAQDTDWDEWLSAAP